MNIEPYQQLAQRAREDPGFFHALIFNPQSVLSEFEGLDRQTQAKILSINPDTFVENLVMPFQQCGITCGDDSCEKTCGMRSCNVTCASSCSASTCGGSSCGETTFLQLEAL